MMFDPRKIEKAYRAEWPFWQKESGKGEKKQITYYAGGKAPYFAAATFTSESPRATWMKSIIADEIARQDG